MEVLAVADKVSIELSTDRALVLFDWLSRMGESNSPTAFEDQAEQRVVWDTISVLETLLSQTFREDYHELVEAARASLRDPED